MGKNEIKFQSKLIAKRYLSVVIHVILNLHAYKKRWMKTFSRIRIRWMKSTGASRVSRDLACF